jgi:hypothetical protein
MCDQAVHGQEQPVSIAAQVASKQTFRGGPDSRLELAARTQTRSNGDRCLPNHLVGAQQKRLSAHPDAWRSHVARGTFPCPVIYALVRERSRYSDYQDYANDDSDHNQQSPKCFDAHALFDPRKIEIVRRRSP